MTGEPRFASAAIEANGAYNKHAKIRVAGIALALPHCAEWARQLLDKCALSATGGTDMKRLGLIVVTLATLSIAPGLAAPKEGRVIVLYAGSLVNLMEHAVGPAFDKATGNQFQGYTMGSHRVGNQFQGYAMGSRRLAKQIKGNLRQGDVFISASPKVNDSLMGAANGDWESWYITFAQSPLVIGYNALSKFSAEFKTKPWYKVLQEPGIRIGRTAPEFDPKGELTLTLLKRAETVYKSPGLSEKIIGRPTVPEDLETTLLQSGLLDVGFFYSTETTDAKIPALNLPSEIAPKAVFTVTILNRAPNPKGAEKFVAYLLGSDGRNLLKEHGLTLQKMEVSGDASAVPHDIKAIMGRIM